STCRMCFLSYHFFTCRPPHSTLFPYTTLFRSLSKFRQYFESLLHDHLSYSTIPDSRFDPAELAFCLEGLLRIQRSSVDRALMDRDRKSTRLNSSHVKISYAVFCLKKKKEPNID